jgi:UDP-glucose 4-epimerase
VTCLDNFFNGSLDNVRHHTANRRFRLVRGDVCDAGLVYQLARDADAIVHLAAQIHVDRSIVEPRLTWDVNVGGTLNVLEAARMTDVERVIHASTSEVYGSAQYAPMDEKHPLDAPHPYGASKIAADRMCRAYHATYDLPVTVLRPFNIYGERQKDTGYGGAISIFAKRALAGLPPLVYGTGEQTRDYTYVSDAVAGYLAALDARPFVAPINLGTGTDVPINAIARIVCRLAGTDLAPVYTAPRPNEIARLVADTTLAKRWLGWAPAVGLEEGIRAVVEWHRTHPNAGWEAPR